MTFGEIRPVLDGADIRIVNLENPLIDSGTPIPKSGPNLREPEAGAAWLTAARFDAAVLANNHICDYSPEGVLRKIR